MTAKYVGKAPNGDASLYRMGELQIWIAGPKERTMVGWHMSISHPSRNPTWEEQKSARYQLIPDEVYMVSVLPPKKEFVSVHNFCFHWWQANPDLVKGISVKGTL